MHINVKGNLLSFRTMRFPRVYIYTANLNQIVFVILAD